MVGTAGAVLKQQQRVLACGTVDLKIEAKRSSNRSVAQASHQLELTRIPLWPFLCQQRLKVADRQRSQGKSDAAGADSGQQLSRVLCEQKDSGEVGWLFQDLEQGIRCFLHECGG